MIEISLVRHVKVAGAPALYGSTDVMPSIEENKLLLTNLTAFQQQGNAYDLVITSPLKRCRIVAKLFAEQNKTPLQCIDTLQEINFGDFDGIPFDDASFSIGTALGAKHWAMLERFWQSPATATLPQAESLADFNLRIVSAWSELIESCYKQSDGVDRPKRILLLAHGGVIRIILAQILQLDWQNPVLHQSLQIANASVSQITVTRPFEKSDLNHYQVNFIGLPVVNTP
ncbi:histidine phosphatase family protein [Candidatus Colwellia aromaticivorans]|uniref:histidine phosphatase family protein n=1 Tax=Candidatus Colwellia aromaticivorans TaxID=2267621 RepID=UPI000DF48808|nr:histidine phosphatase family protein [Candidatus Colwellia aromaticivorans]